MPGPAEARPSAARDPSPRLDQDRVFPCTRGLRQITALFRISAMRRRIGLGRGCRAVARWILIGTLIYIPWDYGGTTEEGIRRSTYLLSAAIILSILGLAVSAVGKRPAKFATRGSLPDANRGWSYMRHDSLPITLVSIVLLLLAFGWWMVVNARSIYDSDQDIFVSVKNLVPTFPGSLDQAVSAAWMWRATTFLGTVCLVADAVRHSAWVLRLWTTMAAAGSSIALLGLVQKASGAPMIFWREPERPVQTFFATFYYHGNAGAFLNLTLPLTLGLAMRSFSRRSHSAIRALWLTAAVISVVASFANTSRMGQFLGAAILGALLVARLPKAIREVRRLQWSTALFGFLALIVAGFAVIQNSRLERSIRRWDELSTMVDRDSRWSASQAALRAVPDAGWGGFGAGTFNIIFPYYTGESGDRLSGRWRYLHQDYLQTLLEWGWLGSGLWASLFFGGMIVATRNRLAPDTSASWLPRERLLLPLVLLGLASVALHALVDFPLQISSIQIYVAANLGICWGSGNWKDKSRNEASQVLLPHAGACR